MTIYNQVITNALVYQRVEQILRTATQPLAGMQIYENASIRELTDKTHVIYDALKALHKKGTIRRVPYSGGGRTRHAYEWIHEHAPAELVSKVVPEENKLPMGSLFPKKPPTDKPEITVTTTSVTIVTNNIKITVEL